MIIVFFSEAGLKVKLNNELNDTIRKKHQRPDARMWGSWFLVSSSKICSFEK